MEQLRKIPLGVAVSPDMFLTDCPRLYDEIVAGNVPGYMPADKRHAAAMWVVAVNGIWYSTQDSNTARELFDWQLSRQRQKTQARAILSDTEASHDAD